MKGLKRFQGQADPNKREKYTTRVGLRPPSSSGIYVTPKFRRKIIVLGIKLRVSVPALFILRQGLLLG